MSHERQGPPGERKEVPFSNVQFRLLLSRHQVTSEREYAATRSAIAEHGERFFRRGFHNILLVEDGLGVMHPRVGRMNDIAQQVKSYRTAYFHVLKEFSMDDAVFATKVFEEQTVSHFLNAARHDRLEDNRGYQEAFLYSQMSALDLLSRKGVRVHLASEQATQERTRQAVFLQAAAPNPSQFLENLSIVTLPVDQKIAKQVVELAKEHPKKTRILAIFGAFHARIIQSLPEALRQESDMVEMISQETEIPVGELFREIQAGDVPTERKEEIVETLFRYYMSKKR